MITENPMEITVSTAEIFEDTQFLRGEIFPNRMWFLQFGIERRAGLQYISVSPRRLVALEAFIYL